MTKQLKPLNIKEIESEYKPDTSIWRIDDNKMHRLKNVIQDLNEIDRRIILLYAETGSQREVAKALGVSVATTNGIIKRIREEIISKL